MKTFHSLIFFVLLATLQDGDACLVGGYIHAITETVGRNITLGCSFDNPEQMKIFCKDDCKTENVILQTAGGKAQRGRFSMEYDEQTAMASMISVYVTITDLRKSDSGRYICKAGRISSRYLTQVFDLTVVDAPTTTQPTSTTQHLPPSTPPASSETPPPFPPPSVLKASVAGVVLYSRLLLGLVMTTVLLAAVVIIFMKMKNRRREGPRAEPPYVIMTEAGEVYEV